MDVFYFIIKIIELVIYILLSFSVIYIFIFSTAGIFYKEPKTGNKIEKADIAVLIPGYKEDAVIVETAKHALQQNYPQEKYDVIIIADSFHDETLKKLKELPIKLIEVSFEKSTKSKALNKALEQLPGKYEIAIILDADNQMKEDFLTQANNYYQEGNKVIQGHRVAKNLNTDFAVLDAFSEEINNHIFRKGHRVFNLSAALIGSGMIFDYQLFKKYMKKIQAVGGFDKELELNLLKDRHKIKYLNHAYVYDEKVQKASTFKGQRRRWLSAQFIYFGRFFMQAIKHLFMGNIDFFDKVTQMILIPRILLLGLLVIFTSFYAIINLLFEIKELFLSVDIWAIPLIILLFSFVVSIPRKLYKLRFLKAVLSLPKGFIYMFLALFSVKGANKKFIHTQHGSSE